MLNLSGIHKNPLVKILFSLLLGIIVMYVVPYENRGVVLGFSAVLVVLIVILFSVRLLFKNPFPGIVLLLILVLCGMVLLKLKQNHIPLPADKTQYTALALNLPVKTPNSSRIDCRLISVVSGGRIHTIHENVRIFTKPDSMLRNVRIGDSLVFEARFLPLENNANPQSFRYDKYLQNRAIWYTAFIKEGELIAGAYSGKYFLRRQAAIVQSAIVSSFSNHGIVGEQLAILSALVAGERSQIEESLREEYAIAGAMHILAVSGLHVGILYLFLQLILFKRNELPLIRFSRLAIVILVLWAYAFIAGLSPSVIRATLMFSFFQLGKSFNRPASSINILAASALILLVINPLQLFQLGFQFSYLAVLGILVFQPRMEKLLEFKRALPDRLWQLLTVSVSVQLTTFPVALFYFNQFPTYFLLTNVLIIPLVWIIMLLSVLYFICLPLTLLSTFMAKVLSAVLWAMNFLIEWIAALPFALIQNIRFGIAQAVFWGLLVLFGLSVTNREQAFRFFRFALISLCFLLFVELLEYKIQENRDEMIIYASGQNLVISLINGHRHLLLCEYSNAEKFTRDREYLKKFWLNRQISKSKHIIELDSLQAGSTIKSDDFELINTAGLVSFSFAGHNIVYLKNYSFSPAPDDNTISTQTLLVDANSPYPNEMKLQNIRFNKLVICKSTRFYARESWTNFALKRGIPCFDVAVNGAYRLEGR